MQASELGLTRVRVRELLEFFDEKPPTSAKHATSVTAVVGEDLGSGLLKHCLEQVHGAHVDILHDADLRPLKVTTGQKKGPRLDRWIKVAWADGTTTLFQSEIKSWSAHAVGGRSLSVSADASLVSDHMRAQWEGMIGSLGGSQNKINKVLIPMRPPHSLPAAQVAPLLVYWSVVHPEGKDESFFWHSLTPQQHPDGYAAAFDRLAVFSMSTYLRSVLRSQKDTIELWMPDTASRMKWLNAIFQ